MGRLNWITHHVRNRTYVLAFDHVVKERALLVNPMYGELVCWSPGKDQQNFKSNPGKKLLPRQGSTKRVPEASSLSAASSYVGSCPICSSEHKQSKREPTRVKTPGGKRRAGLRSYCSGWGHVCKDTAGAI